MPNSLNRHEIIGNLGRDPEMRFTPGGKPVTQFNVATSRSWKEQGSDEWKEETEWHRIVVWGPSAEQAAEKLRKGHKVYVAGRSTTRQWEGQDGQKRYTTEIIADVIVYLQKGEGGDGGRAQVDAMVDQMSAGARPTGARPDQPAAGYGSDPAGDEAGQLDDLPW